MTCTDCREPIVESERRNARTCAECLRSLHGECSMAGVSEEDLCEVCHDLQRAEIREAMKAMGVEA